jgi:hypothetical protein
MAVKFNQRVLHGRIEFLPGVVVAFEDPNGNAYFTKSGWADTTSEEPVRTYSVEEVSIDPETRHAGTGALVLGSVE